ncbi:GMC oxidoreductase [Metarhizium robertsii]|uniref:GMC oxidoreductase n=2 Tax=Metarhizium robertsii TaxID=568076 RepID=A0A0A1USS6_9HYPO|nr:GMC oxidoreductase [Metarhizium robertsii]
MTRKAPFHIATLNMWPFDSQYPCKRLQDIADQAYDYIIVGGGTAGCALASKLSESPETTVLMLEKGPIKDSYQSRIPLASVANGIYTKRQNSSLGSRPVPILSAETLGGNSRINAMIYTRGTPAYYNQWARTHPDWSWVNVEPYFRKVENSINLCQNRELESNIYPFLRKSASALGLPLGHDINRPDSPAMGYFDLHLTVDSKQHRHSAVRAYLPKEVAVRRRARLHICTGVVASRLHLDASTGLVKGVFVQSSQAKQTDSKTSPRKPTLVKARREVILAAGAIGTPKILQLSGVGPRLVLERVGIPVVRHLPGVGSNLGDHCLFPVHVQVPVHETLQQLQASILKRAKHAVLYAVAGKGWLRSAVDRAILLCTSHFDEEKGAVLATEAADDGETLPDVEIMVVPIGSLPELYPGKSMITLQTCLIQPKSTGTIEITSPDPGVDARIQLNILSDPSDWQVARKACRFALALAEHFIHQSGYPSEARVFAGPGSVGAREWKEGDWRVVSDQEIDTYIGMYVGSGFHLTSSCRMGREEDGGVVDSQLRVHGFKNLRIADASVLPCVPPGHPMAPTYMISERCADFIKDGRN